MQTRSSKIKTVASLIGCLGLAACTHLSVAANPSSQKRFEGLRPSADGLVAIAVKGPVTLRLKAEMGRTERVAYTHRSTSNSYEENQLRHRKDDSLDFISQAETLKVGAANDKGVQVFEQRLTLVKKDGNADMHDFAMADLGEKLDVTANSLGVISKSGDYPPNSIFFVPPVSLPEKPVSAGDTWTMQSSWLSLGEMVPYQLDMVSILKGFWQCGTDTCAEIEISGDVGFQGPLSQTLRFNSTWHGRIYFAMNAGSVVWSRVDSQERLIAEKVRRDVDSCLEAVLTEPKSEAFIALKGVRCEIAVSPDTQRAP